MSSSSFWYHEGTDGAFHLKTHQTPSTLSELSIAVRIALALNDIACEKGEGRVYVLASNRRPAGDLQYWTARMKVPQLFYVSEPWSAGEQVAWQSGSWQFQVSRSCAQNGWLERQCNVLPFRITVHNQQLQKPQFEALTIAPVSIYFAPHPYIGLSQDMDRIATMGYYRDDRRNAGITRYTYTVEGGWDEMQQWRVLGVSEVLQELHRLFWSEECASNVMWFGTLYEDFLQAAATFSALT